VVVVSRDERRPHHEKRDPHILQLVDDRKTSPKWLNRKKTSHSPGRCRSTFPQQQQSQLDVISTPVHVHALSHMSQLSNLYPGFGTYCIRAQDVATLIAFGNWRGLAIAHLKRPSRSCSLPHESCVTHAGILLWIPSLTGCLWEFYHFALLHRPKAGCLRNPVMGSQNIYYIMLHHTSSGRKPAVTQPTKHSLCIQASLPTQPWAIILIPTAYHSGNYLGQYKRQLYYICSWYPGVTALLFLSGREIR